jgi:ribonuclease P protein component
MDSVPGDPAAFVIQHIRRRPDFLAAQRGRSVAKGAVVVQALPRPGQGVARAGFTATRKIGGAVVRNRAKRRLREAARLMLPQFGRAGMDYVFIARGGTTGRPWSRLLDDVKSALISLAPIDGGAGSGSAPAAPIPPCPPPPAA